MCTNYSVGVSTNRRSRSPYCPVACSLSMSTQSFGGLQAAHSCRQDYVPQSRPTHRQHTGARVREAREAQPVELLAAILMLTARSVASDLAVSMRIAASSSTGWASWFTVSRSCACVGQSDAHFYCPEHTNRQTHRLE